MRIISDRHPGKAVFLLKIKVCRNLEGNWYALEAWKNLKDVLANKWLLAMGGCVSRRNREPSTSSVTSGRQSSNGAGNGKILASWWHLSKFKLFRACISALSADAGDNDHITRYFGWPIYIYFLSSLLKESEGLSSSILNSVSVVKIQMFFS